MTVSEQKLLEEMQKTLDRLANEIDDLKKANKHGFERLDTDQFLIQAYN